MEQENVLPEPEEKREIVQSMFDTIAPKYDLLNRLLTFRLDVRWRKKSLKTLALNPNSMVMDLACGTGDFAKELVKQGHTPLGIDLSLGMLQSSPHDISLIQGDLLNLPIKNQTFDAAVCGFALRNLTDLKPFYEELFRTIKPGGRIALLDVSEPKNKFLRFGHKFYFNKVVPKIGSLLSDKQAYTYLPASVTYLPEPEKMKQLLTESGFIDIDHQLFSGGISQLYTATRQNP